MVKISIYAHARDILSIYAHARDILGTPELDTTPPTPTLPHKLSARQFLRLLGVEVTATESQAVIQTHALPHNATNANPVAPYSNGASGAESNHPDALL